MRVHRKLIDWAEAVDVLDNLTGREEGIELEKVYYLGAERRPYF